MKTVKILKISMIGMLILIFSEKNNKNMKIKNYYTNLKIKKWNNYINMKMKFNNSDSWRNIIKKSNYFNLKC